MTTITIQYYPVANEGEIEWKIELYLTIKSFDGIQGNYAERTREAAIQTANRWAEALRSIIKDDCEVVIRDCTR